MIGPVLLKIGAFEIRYYGLVYVLGFLLVYYFLYKNKEKLNFSKDDIDEYLIYLVLGTVIGARILHVIIEYPYYLNDLKRIFYFWEGGMAFFGGLLGSILVSYYYLNKKNISFYKVADVIVVPLSLALSLGRIANFINGELFGKITDVSWCIIADNVCRHPYQLYEFIGRFLAFLILLSLSFKKFRAGFLFWMFILLISLSRFVNEFFRDNVTLLGLNPWQYLSLGLIFVSTYVIIRNYCCDFMYK